MDISPIAAGLNSATPLTHRLARRTRFSPEDEAILLDLQSATRVVPRNREILGAGARCDALLIVIDGFLLRYRILRDGERQIVNVVLPGDFIGVLGGLFGNALFSFRTLTPVTIAAVSLSRVGALVDAHPNLAAKLLWSFSGESAIYAERLISIGRRSALERVAHFLLELLMRLQVVGLADERSFCIPLTQRMIADALGLRSPCINRAIQQLRREDLVLVDKQRVVVKNITALSSLAGFDPAYLTGLSVDRISCAD